MNSLDSLIAELTQARSRALIWLETSFPQQDRSLSLCIEQLGLPRQCGVLISDRELAGLDPINAAATIGLLGQTIRFGVLDCFAGFNPNHLAQLAGSIQAGGVLILMTPPESEWRAFADPEYLHLGYDNPQLGPGRFLRWVIATLRSGALLRWSGLRSGLPALPADSGWNSDDRYKSDDQARVVPELLQHWAQAESTLILTADRGRGKSAAIGIALALMRRSMAEVVICAPARSAVVSLYQQFAACSDVQSEPEFLLPAELLTRIARSAKAPRLLVIDEAAGIPVPALLRLAELTPHLLLSTTTHGYEGHGRGFGLRFIRRLAQLRGEYRQLSLSEPIRWSRSDCLEPLLNEMLLMDLEAPKFASDSCDISINEVTPEQLVADRGLLRACFELLTHAHYRTSPADLRVLLDAPGQRLLLVQTEGQLLGVCWLAEEGIADPDLARQVYQGRRRPNGNLIPQTLLYHCGWPQAQAFRALRIVRIAVQPDGRRSGVGSALLESARQMARAESFDLLGASFAFDADIHRFWRSAGFSPVRLGDQIDSVAAAPACLVLAALSDAARAWLPDARRRFAVMLNYQSDNLALIGRGADSGLDGNCDSEMDTELLENFAHHFAPLSLVKPALDRLSQQQGLTVEARDRLLQAIDSPRLNRSQLKALRALVASLLSRVTQPGHAARPVPR